MLWSSCVDLLRPSSAMSSEHMTKTISVLKKNNLSFTNGLLPFTSIEKLLEMCPELGFVTSKDLINSFEKLLSSESDPGERNSDVIRYLRTHREVIIRRILQDDDFSNISMLLIALTELTEIKIKLWEYVGEILTCQRMGNGKCAVVHFLGTSDSLVLLQKDGSCHKALTNVSSTDVSLEANSPKKEVNTKKPLRKCRMNVWTVNDFKNKGTKKITENKSFVKTKDLFDDFDNDSLSGADKTPNPTPRPNFTRPQSKNSSPGSSVFDVKVSGDPFQAKVISQDTACRVGRLKFFSEESEFGFLINEQGEEIFVHKDDLVKAGIDTVNLAYQKKFYEIQISFRTIQYQGRTKVSRKAVDLQIVGYLPILLSH